MRRFTRGDLNKQLGDVTGAAAREPVVLTKRRKLHFVLMSFNHAGRMRPRWRSAPRLSAPPSFWMSKKELFGVGLDRLTRGHAFDDEP